MFHEYLRLSWNSLRTRKMRSWLTLIGVVIGIAAVISLIGLGEGLRNFVTAQFSVADADLITIQAAGVASAGPPGAGVVNPLTDRELDAVRNVKGVQTAVGRLLEATIVEYSNMGDVVFFVSVPDGTYRKDVYDIGNYEVEEGRLLKDGDTHRVVIGHDFTDKDRFGKPMQIGSKITVDETDYTVVGILKKKGSFTHDSGMLMNEKSLREQFGTDKDEYDMMGARAAKGADIKQIKEDIEKTLRKVRSVDEGEEDFTVETSEAAVQNLNDTLFAIQLFIYIIAGISILVGGIGIMNTMFTAVLERTKDIGTMKAVGAKNSTIFKLFFIESGLIGLVGGLIGVILGTAAAYGLSAAAAAALGIDMIQAHVSLGLILGALAFSFVVGTIAGVVPAQNASKLNPVDALAYEK